jgi:hypothetical protein
MWAIYWLRASVVGSGMSATNTNRSASLRAVSTVSGKSANSRVARCSKEASKAHSRAVNSRLIGFSGGIRQSIGAEASFPREKKTL